jgi:hypothetical protein
MMDKSNALPYSPLKSLTEARAVSDGVVILQGDDGGQIYVVCRASEVSCGVEVLDGLLLDLDDIAWPGNDPTKRRVFYERLPVGAGVAGGMGGGRVTDEPWIHKEFVKLRLAPRIIEVLQGKRDRIR